MNIDQKIQDAVKPVVPVCVLKQYGGDAEEYCVYAYSFEPMFFMDNIPFGRMCSISLHWFFPWRPKNSESSEVQAKKKKLIDALMNSGFSLQEVYSGDDEEWDEFVFECTFEDFEEETP